MKTIAITGSSGFIGSHLMKSLQNKTFILKELDLIKGIDICNWNEISNLSGIDVFIHLAAKSFVPDSFKTPHQFYNINVASTLNILELARLNGAKVIYFSSYLYGTPEYLPIDEKHPVTPHNPYAQSKLICEKLCEGYHRDFNVPVIIMRPFNIYGPGQNSSFLIPSIIKQLKEDKIILKDPRPKRDFIYIDDIVNAVLKAIDYKKTGFEIFNLGTGKSFSVEEVVCKILNYAEKRPELCFTNEYRKEEVLDTIANISKVSDALQWIPEIDFDQGLSKIFQ